MVAEMIESVLFELSNTLKIPNLHLDGNNTCRIKWKGGMHLQIEIDRSGNNILIGTDLGPVPPGVYRERIFSLALQVNSVLSPRCGTFGYSKNTDHLALFEMIPLRNLRGERIAEFLTPFMEKAHIWKEAITKGDLPPGPNISSGPLPGGIFGLRP